MAARAAVKHEPVQAPRILTQPEIDAVRARRDELLATWHALAAGEEIVLEFGDV